MKDKVGQEEVGREKSCVRISHCFLRRYWVLVPKSLDYLKLQDTRATIKLRT